MKKMFTPLKSFILLMLLATMASGPSFAQLQCQLKIISSVVPGNPLQVEFKALPADSLTANQCFSPFTNYIWQFGDNTTVTDTGSTIFHTYNQFGTYGVCVFALSNNGQMIEECDTLYLDSIPNACPFSFSFQPGLPTVPFNFQFFTSGILGTNCYPQGTNLLWSWGDGTSTNTTNQLTASKTYSGPGTYSVCLTVTSAFGTTQTFCLNVSAGFTPPAKFMGRVHTAGTCDPSLTTVRIVSLDGQLDTTDYLNNIMDSCVYFHSIPSQPVRNYVIWANPVGNPNYLPTYLGDRIYYSEATIISNPTNLNQTALLPNINLVPDVYGSLVWDSLQPPGSITGNVGGNGTIVTGTLGNRPTSINYQNSSARVFILNAAGQPVASVNVNADGSYTSPNLPPGTYTVRVEHPLVPSAPSQVTITPGSLNRVANFTVTPTGVNNVTSNQSLLRTDKLKIYPNPAQDNVKVFGVKGNVQFIDMQGKISLETSADNAISISNLKSGIYLVKGQDENGNILLTRLSVK